MRKTIKEIEADIKKVQDLTAYIGKCAKMAYKKQRMIEAKNYMNAMKKMNEDTKSYKFVTAKARRMQALIKSNKLKNKAIEEIQKEINVMLDKVSCILDKKVSLLEDIAKEVKASKMPC